MKRFKNFRLNESTEIEYTLGDNTINGVEIHEKISQDQLFDYEIRNREDFIDDLIDWISEASGNNKELMKDDLKMLFRIDDEYIFSSISTNDYIYKECGNFNDTCQELLDFNENFERDMTAKDFNL